VPLRIESTLLAIVGGIVPEKVRKILAGPDDGLPARFIFVWPEPMPIAPLRDCGATDAAERRFRLEKAAERLRALGMGMDYRGEPAPLALPLDRDARGLFDEQRQEAMRQARAESSLAAGWYGKNPGRILRLSLVFELLAWTTRDGVPEPASVSADAVARAGGYIDYAAAMMERVIEGLAIGAAEADAAQIARHVQEIARRAPPRALLKPLNERALYQTRGFSWARNKKRRTEALMVLQEAGWVRIPQADGAGSTPRRLGGEPTHRGGQAMTPTPGTSTRRGALRDD
jgi:putative DNA primase/helicase